jgi:tetratricopeptide (TPR) repeat protein
MMTNYRKYSAIVFFFFCLYSMIAVRAWALPSASNLTNAYNITGCNIGNQTCLQHYLTCLKDDYGKCCPPQTVCGGAELSCDGCPNYGDAFTTSPQFHQITVRTASPLNFSQPQQNQGNTTLIYHQSQLEAYKGNYSNALSLYKKILKIEPYDIDALGGIGRILYSLNNYTGAIQYLDKALSIDPKNVYALDGKGLALYHLKNYTGALSVLNKGLNLDPYFYGMLDNKAITLIKLGKYVDAISTLNTQLQHYPRDEYAWYNLGYGQMDLSGYLSRHGEINMAIDNLTKALQNINKGLSINSEDRDAQHLKTALIEFFKHYPSQHRETK